jgi:hypothetical protein
VALTLGGRHCVAQVRRQMSPLVVRSSEAARVHQVDKLHPREQRLNVPGQTDERLSADAALEDGRPGSTR